MDGASAAKASDVNEWVGVIGDLGVYHDLQGGASVTGVT